MNSPKVSIVVPVYNKELYILDCLKSLLSQTFQDWECILVDDGSTDNSLSIIQDFVEQNPRNWSILSKVNEGPSAARNLGILNARGAYLAFIDADDIWLPEKLAKQIEYMEFHQDIDLSLTNYVIFDVERSTQLRGIRAPAVDKLLSRWLDMRGFGGLVESTGMLRRKAVNNALLFDATLKTTEGLDFVFKWQNRGKVSVLRDFLTLYRISPGQLHEREDLVRQNAVLIAERHSHALQQTQRTRDFQRAYFYLSNLRNKNKIRILKAFSLSLITFDMRVFQMALWLVTRNIHARILPIRLRKLINSLLKT